MLSPMPRMQATILGVVAGLSISGAAAALTLADITARDAAQALKDGLAQSAGRAVSQLAALDGFLGNEKVKIPLPDSLRRIESGLRLIGMGDQADELVTSMNRAAEVAVKEALPLLADAIKKMSVQDAKRILTSGDDAATQYFRQTTSGALAKRFLPIVKQITAKVQLAEQYNALAGHAAQFGLIHAEDASIDSYVTRRALDGLYLVMAEQERAIRKDPVRATTSIAKKVFGVLR
jgi:hypothetical protein